MSGAQKFDANKRLAEIALWTDSGARWIDRATASKQPNGQRGEVTVTLDRRELEAFVIGLRRVSQSLLGIVQPVPPPLPRPSQPSTCDRPYLRVVGT